MLNLQLHYRCVDASSRDLYVVNTDSRTYEQNILLLEL